MVFSSAIFLFCFLPAVFLLYRLPFGRRWQNALLACASLVFYAFGNLHYVPLFLLSVLLNYATGLLLGGRLQRSKPLIALNIVLNLGILCVFKYTDFLIGNANALFGLNRIDPVYAGPVPASILPLITRHVLNQENTLTSALRCDRKLGLTTFLNDPQLSGVTPADGEKLFNDMLENQRTFLPEKWFK